MLVHNNQKTDKVMKHEKCLSVAHRWSTGLPSVLTTCVYDHGTVAICSYFSDSAWQVKPTVMVSDSRTLQGFVWEGGYRKESDHFRLVDPSGQSSNHDDKEDKTSSYVYLLYYVCIAVLTLDADQSRGLVVRASGY